jgi:hypothetical protein
MSDSKIFSLEGKSLKLDTTADVEPHIEALRELEDVREIRLQGNTIGIEAAAALAEVLRTKKTLEVKPPPASITIPLCGPSSHVIKPSSSSDMIHRSQTWAIFSLVACSPRSQLLFHPSSPPFLSFQACTPST